MKKNFLIKIICYLRFIVNFIFISQRPVIILASIGRYESILKFLTIAKSLAKERIPFLLRILGEKFSGGRKLNSHKKLFNGFFYKTNLMPKDLSENKNAKIIFLFRMPSDVILLAISNIYRKVNKRIFRHFYHLKVNSKFKDFFTKYNLQIKKQITNWQSKKVLNSIILRYEKIWYYQLEIEDFINLKLISLDKKKCRKLIPEAEALKQTCIDSFKSLDNKVCDIDDFQILF